MYMGPPLQPLLWDILVRPRILMPILLANIQKAFLQIDIKVDDRDAFRISFSINGKEEHLRFTRVPFGVEESPFLLGTTLQYHYEQQSSKLEDTLEALKRNKT